MWSYFTSFTQSGPQLRTVSTSGISWAFTNTLYRIRSLSVVPNKWVKDYQVFTGEVSFVILSKKVQCLKYPNEGLWIPKKLSSAGTLHYSEGKQWNPLHATARDIQVTDFITLVAWFPMATTSSSKVTVANKQQSRGVLEAGTLKSDRCQKEKRQKVH